MLDSGTNVYVVYVGVEGFFLGISLVPQICLPDCPEGSYLGMFISVISCIIYVYFCDNKCVMIMIMNNAKKNNELTTIFTWQQISLNNTA